ncbi:Olfactory receptor 2AJ1 [Sciurus carolinensis]|uniref:Olfactory receptor 2AJ1 n=1 Tax=Sciurus carolinensis TaxID=30640 RepID=A0AA41TAB5_SCICA|nr:Olfactory receptor 2AJ1 [Sciurus carolinensis]
MDHCFCEKPTILRVSCADVSVHEILRSVLAEVFLLAPFLPILASYPVIFSLSSERTLERAGTKPATCPSHLTVVSLYFGQDVFIYMTPSPAHTPEQGQKGAVLSTLLTPTLNPSSAA